MSEADRKAKLENDKLEAEIGKLVAERDRLLEESKKFQAEATRLASESDKLISEQARLAADTLNLGKWERFEWFKSIASIASLIAAVAAVIALAVNNASLTSTQKAQATQQQNQFLADLTEQLASDKRAERTSAASRLGNLLGGEVGTSAKGADVNSQQGISEPVVLNILVWALAVEEDPLVRSALVGSIRRSKIDINNTLTEAIKLTAADITPQFEQIPDVQEILKDNSTVSAEVRTKLEQINQRQASMVTLASLRFERQTQGANSGIDLRGLPLTSFVFVGTAFDLQKADFTGASLYHADFYGVDLTAANFSGADLSSVNFKLANLEGAKFIDAQIYWMSDGVEYPRANFEQAALGGAEFERACLAGADFSAADIEFAAQVSTASIADTLFNADQDAMLAGAERHARYCKE